VCRTIGAATAHRPRWLRQHFDPLVVAYRFNVNARQPRYLTDCYAIGPRSHAHSKKPCFCSRYRMHLIEGCCPGHAYVSNTRSRAATSNSLGGGAMYYVVNGRMCIVCYRVVDMPKPRVQSERQRCANCCEPIWVAKQWPAEPAKICSQCTEGNDPASKKREQQASA
jgi:hypothetical protein